MAKIQGSTLPNEAFDQWVASRPDKVQELIRKLPPDRLYLLKTSGHRVTIYSYNEDNTLTVTVTGKYNMITFARNVFGIKPEDLEECDLPGPDEPLGELLKDPKDIEAYCKHLRKAEL